MQSRTRILLGTGGAVALSLVAAAAFAFAADAHDPMAMFDKDGNGALNQSEVRQGARTMFAKVDANKDGRLGHDELDAHHRQMAGGDHRERPGGGGDRPAAGGPPHSPGGPLHMDKDGDGAITLAELQGGLEQLFVSADANRDRSVSREEMDAAHRAMRQHH